MRVHHEYDFLLSASSTSELHNRHVHDTPEQVALVRAALHNDARVDVRRNAVVALEAALSERSIPDCIAALNDPAPEVLSEAAAGVATYAPAYLSRPENPAALAALRSHAAAPRSALASSNETVRYNAAMALRVTADAQVDLGVLLRDDSPLVRREGLALASARPLAAPDVKALDELAHNDPDQQLRTQAVNAVAYYAPALALSVLQAAFARGDVDNGTANAIEGRKLTAATPAILGYLQRQPKAVRWLQTLVAFKATCAARAIAGLLSDDTAGFPATEALRALSGHPDWPAAQLAAWAAQQPGDVAPCVAPPPASPGRSPGSSR
jgi:HEAT repeat protein